MVICFEHLYLTPQTGLVYDDRRIEHESVFNVKEA
jgi:hypothetical protein